MAIGKESEGSHDDASTDNDRPPVGGKRRMIREGGSASRVSIKARPRDPGGGTVSTDPRRRIVLYDVIVSVEQPREEPLCIMYPTTCNIHQFVTHFIMVICLSRCLYFGHVQHQGVRFIISSIAGLPYRFDSTNWKALAEDTHIQECFHDVVGLYAHKGTMWITDDRMPQKNIKLPCGGGLTFPGAAGGLLPAMFPVASALPIDEPQLDSWQVIVVRVDETPARDSSEQEPLVIHITGVGRWI